MPKNPTAPKPPHPFPPGEVVDPSWLLKACAIVVGFAMACSLVLVCLVFNKTQWQFVLHPSRVVLTTPAAVSLAFTEVHFGVDASGQPQLDGWWIPSDLPTDPTVLLLHTGDGSMSDALPQARALHDARLNVLLFDYRGFGHSGGQHPTEALMQGDATSAFNYLATTRNIPPKSILVFGERTAASLAVQLCAEHKDLAALILYMPDGDFESRVRHDNRTLLVPVRWLFTQQFPLAAPLSTLSTPKLLLAHTDSKSSIDLRRVADPKMTVEYSDEATLPQIYRRFLDTYVTH